MFKVENADFIADKLAAELLPDQEYREAYKNSEEAVDRRQRAEAAGGEEMAPGRIEFDVDWPLLASEGRWFLCCADNGDGMTRSELERYVTTLAVTGANQNQSLTGNQGMGLKIAGPTRHKNGVLVRSYKDGELSMVNIGWNGREYGLLPLGPHGQVIVEVSEDHFPNFVIEQGSGTVVTFLGSDSTANTVVPDHRTRNWLFKYLYQRFFRLEGSHIALMVRQPARDISEWPRTRSAADAGKGFNLARVYGTAHIWDDAADRDADPDGPARRGSVELPGNLNAGVPGARMHWWVLPPSGPGSDVSTRTAGGGSLAVLFQNELHDWRVSGQANPFFARLGIIFGKTRIAFVLEPLGAGIASDFARAHVLVNNRPVFEGEAWPTWADQFRERMPDVIKDTIAAEQSKLADEDPDRAKRIRDRLKDVMQLLRPRRARRDPDGKIQSSDVEVTGPEDGTGFVIETPVGSGVRDSAPREPKGIGAALAVADDGEPASEVFSMLQLTPRWVTELQAENFPIVNANGRGLADRAAALAGVDGLKAEELLLNVEFRGYQMILQALSEWGNPDGDDAVAVAIESFTREWIEQKMVEAVTGLRQLENGSTWTAGSYDNALSPVALTAAFMADRYHTLREVRRQIGPLRQKAIAVTEEVA
jgi:hypothetical protein